MVAARILGAGQAKRGGKSSVARLRAAAEKVLASSALDLHEALADLQAALGERWAAPKASVTNIVCNPPYSYEPKIAERFIRRALEVTRRKLAMLLPTKFNSSNGRHALFTGTPLARIHTLCSRPSMPPGSLLTAGKIKAKGGKVDYAWFVWERGHTGPPTNHYLILPEKLDAQRRRAKTKEAA